MVDGVRDYGQGSLVAEKDQRHNGIFKSLNIQIEGERRFKEIIAVRKRNAMEPI